MKVLQIGTVTVALALTVFLGGCATTSHHAEHYVSPAIQGETAKINLDEVQKAFWDTKGKDFDTWMAAFEKRVNEIYEGKEIVSIDATRDNGKLVVTGFLPKSDDASKKKEGFQPGDEKLFSIEQTGEAADNEMPYRVANSDGRTYYEGHHSILDNPILQVMLLSHMMGGWGGRYYTPYQHVIVLHDSRNQWRSSPQYTSQQTNNSGFFSRFKSKSLGGGYESKTGFGNSSFSGDSGSKKRNFSFGSSSPSSSSTSSGSSFSWGGRRSGSVFGGGSSRGWGGRRR